MRQVALPWAEPLSRFTVLFERLAIDVLKECDVVGACRILKLSWRRRPRSPGAWPFEDQRPDRSRIWRFIEKKSEHFAITTLCRVCRVSHSAYYDWLNRVQGPSEADLEETVLANRIYDI